MTRVYEALKRASKLPPHRAGSDKSSQEPPAAAAHVAADDSPHLDRREGVVTASLHKATLAEDPASDGSASVQAAGSTNGGNGHHKQSLLDVPEALQRSSAVFRAPGEDAAAVDQFVVRPGFEADEDLADGQQPHEIIQPAAGASRPVDSSLPSAFTERTDVAATAGPALSGGMASRVAGATVNAVGSTRAANYASLEVDTARVEPHLVALTDPQSSHAERYRSLRTRVLHAGEKKHLQALVVTSAGTMEGKTVTALNLAWLLAQTDGVRALLIDGDLRHPCAGEYLGIDVPIGLSEVLAGEAKLEETIVRLEPAGLYLLPGGRTRDDVTELLSGPKFSAVLTELRRSFNFIIMDAPPLDIFTDATVLINRADSALVVVRSGQTRFSTLDRVLEPLPRERLLGVVLNAAEVAPNESNYYYKRRYYRRDGQPGGADGAAAATEQVLVEEEIRG